MNQRKKKRLQLKHKQLQRKFNALPPEKQREAVSTSKKLAEILPDLLNSGVHKLDDYALAGG